MVTKQGDAVDLVPKTSIGLAAPPQNIEMTDALLCMWQPDAPVYMGPAQPLSSWALQVLTRLLNQDELSAERLKQALNYLAYEMTEPSAAQLPANLKDRLIDYMHTQIDQSFSIEQAAEDFAISRSSFLRRCQRHLGQSPMKFLATLRIQRAKELLEESNLTIAQVGYRVGYDTPSSFSHFFRNATGMSPRNYRLNCEWLI